MNRIRLSEAQVNKLRDAGRAILEQVQATGRAMLQHSLCAMKYLVWKARIRRASSETPPRWPDPATRPRAAIGGVIVVLLAALVGISVGPSPTPPKTGTGGVATFQPRELEAHPVDSNLVVDDQTDEPVCPAHSAPITDDQKDEPPQVACTDDESPSPAGDADEQEAEAEELAGMPEPARPERRQVGVVRIRIPVPDRSFSNGQRDRSSGHRLYSPPTSARPELDSFVRPRADYARQRAVEQAQYEAERAMRDYRQQVSGSMGAMGVPWGGRGPGYGRAIIP